MRCPCPLQCAEAAVNGLAAWPEPDLPAPAGDDPSGSVGGSKENVDTVNIPQAVVSSGTGTQKKAKSKAAASGGFTSPC